MQSQQKPAPEQENFYLLKQDSPAERVCTWRRKTKSAC